VTIGFKRFATRESGSKRFWLAEQGQLFWSDATAAAGQGGHDIGAFGVGESSPGRDFGQAPLATEA
jgi:hypothetical protein